MPPGPSTATRDSALAAVRVAVATFEAEYQTYRKASENFRASAEKCLDVVLRALSKPGSATDGSTGISASSRIRKDVPRLSKRELQILKLIAEGSGTKQAAEAMGIAFKTAVGHRSKLMQKLGVHDAASLTRYAIRSGHVEP